MRELCVVFDIDDTLYLEHDYVMSGFAAVGDWARRNLGIPDLDERCLATYTAGRRGTIFNSVLADCGVNAADDMVAELVGIYRSHLPRITLSHDAAIALAGISRRWPVAVISDGPAISQSRKAEALQLARFADPICLTERLGAGCSKPNPLAFETVARPRRGRHHVYVADNPEKDFTAPLGLGWSAIRIRRPGGLHFARPNTAAQPHFELPDCSDLEKLLLDL